MGGEMIFYHNDKVIEDLDSYKKILEEMKNDCASLPETAPGEPGWIVTCTISQINFRMENFRCNLSLIPNPISNWKDGYVTKYGASGVGQDDDYELSIDLGTSIRNASNHYYVLFPKDPNRFKVLSHTHARGFSFNPSHKKWIHDYFVKFVTTFPGVFTLYYGDGCSGYDEIGEIDYKDGSDVPVERTYPELEDPLNYPSTTIIIT